jgi:hypothetical protein
MYTPFFIVACYAIPLANTVVLDLSHSRSSVVSWSSACCEQKSENNLFRDDIRRATILSAQ